MFLNINAIVISSYIIIHTSYLFLFTFKSIDQLIVFHFVVK